MGLNTGGRDTTFVPGDVVSYRSGEGPVRCVVLEVDARRGVRVSVDEERSRWLQPRLLMPWVSLRDRINATVLDPFYADRALRSCEAHGIDIDHLVPLA